MISEVFTHYSSPLSESKSGSASCVRKDLNQKGFLPLVHSNILRQDDTLFPAEAGLGWVTNLSWSKSSSI